MAQWIKRHMSRAQDRWSSAIARSQPTQASHALLPVLRATNHDEHSLPDEDAVVEVIRVIGSQSRVHVAQCVDVMLERLSKTKSWVVALKSLILLHRCFCDGGFMFQDQIGLHRELSGGRNRLNMSNFNDTSSALSWAGSRWIRWYAGFVEKWIQTSRESGLFFNSDSVEESDHPLALPTSAFVSEFLLIHEFLREASMAADVFVDHHLVKGSLTLVLIVVRRVYREVRFRVKQMAARIQTLTQSEAASLLQVCDKLSTESMLLTHLIDVCGDVTERNVGLQKVLITESELLNLKRDLNSAL